MDHPTDKQLDKWLRLSGSLSKKEADSIESHVQSCRLCTECVEALKAYYEDLEKELDQGAGVREQSLASKIYRDRQKGALPESSLLIQTYEAPLVEHRQTVPVRFANYIRRHSVGTATVTLATAFIAVLFLITNPLKNTDQNPFYAEVEQNQIRTYNSEGELLWNMAVNGMPNNITSGDQLPNSGNPIYLMIDDIDGDGINEILLTGDNERNGFVRERLYCLNNDGTLRWERDIKPPGSFISSMNQNIGWWRVLGFFTHADSDQKKPQLFAYARAGVWSPSVLYEIEANSGEILQEYWHTGHIQTAMIYNNVIEGVNELLVGAINDTYDLAALAVLNPNDFGGLAPGKELFEADVISRSKVKYYITFKPTIITELYHTAPYNRVHEIIPIENGNLIIHTQEKLGRLLADQSVSIYYVLDSNYNVIDVYGDDNFIKFYSEKYEDGEIEEPLSEGFWEDLKESIRYWNGEQFVSEPVRAD